MDKSSSNNPNSNDGPGDRNAANEKPSEVRDLRTLRDAVSALYLRIEKCTPALFSEDAILRGDRVDNRPFIALEFLQGSEGDNESPVMSRYRQATQNLYNALVHSHAAYDGLTRNRQPYHHGMLRQSVREPEDTMTYYFYDSAVSMTQDLMDCFHDYNEAYENVLEAVDAGEPIPETFLEAFRVSAPIMFNALDPIEAEVQEFMKVTIPARERLEQRAMDRLLLQTDRGMQQTPKTHISTPRAEGKAADKATAPMMYELQNMVMSLYFQLADFIPPIGHNILEKHDNFDDMKALRHATFNIKKFLENNRDAYVKPAMAEAKSRSPKGPLLQSVLRDYNNALAFVEALQGEFQTVEQAQKSLPKYALAKDAALAEDYTAISLALVPTIVPAQQAITNFTRQSDRVLGQLREAGLIDDHNKPITGITGAGANR